MLNQIGGIGSTKDFLMTHLVVLGQDDRDAAAGVIEELKPFGPSVIQTSLSREREDELVQALRA
jgi:uncharacterized membrane protein